MDESYLETQKRTSRGSNGRLTLHQSFTDEGHTQPPRSSTGGNETTELGIGALVPPKERLVPGEVGRGDRNSKQHCCQFWQAYKTIFGTVSVHVYRIVREPSNGDSELPFTEEDTCSTEVEIQFTPRLWLARKASHVTGAWESSPHRNTWRFNIQSFPVVDHNSEIIKACASYDIRKMQTLFDSNTHLHLMLLNGVITYL
jgi:hypothetical protein